MVTCRYKFISSIMRVNIRNITIPTSSTLSWSRYTCLWLLHFGYHFDNESNLSKCGLKLWLLSDISKSLILVFHHCALRISSNVNFLKILYWRDKLVFVKSNLTVLTVVSNDILESRISLFLFKIESLSFISFFLFSSRNAIVEAEFNLDISNSLVLLLWYANLDFISSWSFTSFLTFFVSFTFHFFKVNYTLNSLLYASWRSSFSVDS